MSGRDYFQVFDQKVIHYSRFGCLEEEAEANFDMWILGGSVSREKECMLGQQPSGVL